ncbi:MAG TPA: hypothetical protein VFC78_02150 [Tepidisphaeraceae bacterium]|nr:hypothetical protein [Tepidisphaeraceae bacterium]
MTLENAPFPPPLATPLDYGHELSLIAQRRRRSATLWLRIFALMLLFLAIADVIHAAARAVIFRRATLDHSYAMYSAWPLLLQAAVWSAMAGVGLIVIAAIRRGGRRVLQLAIGFGMLLELLLVVYTTAKGVHLLQFGLRRSVHLLQVLIGQLSLLLAAAAILGVTLQQLISLYRFEHPPRSRR